MFAFIRPTDAERRQPRPGDDLLPAAEVVMDRAFTLDAAPPQVWPWLAQLGKRRAGWYLPRGLERWLPPSRRATWNIHDQWQHLEVGQTIPDYGGRNATFELADVRRGHWLVYATQRGHTQATWSITLVPRGPSTTRVALRLRMSPVKHRWLATTVGELFDVLTIAGMAVGLRQRLQARPGPPTERADQRAGGGS